MHLFFSGKQLFSSSSCMFFARDILCVIDKAYFFEALTAVLNSIISF